MLSRVTIAAPSAGKSWLERNESRTWVMTVGTGDPFVIGSVPGSLCSEQPEPNNSATRHHDHIRTRFMPPISQVAFHPSMQLHRRGWCVCAWALVVYWIRCVGVLAVWE